jgi:hypothetical protein
MAYMLCFFVPQEGLEPSTKALGVPYSIQFELLRRAPIIASENKNMSGLA